MEPDIWMTPAARGLLETELAELEKAGDAGDNDARVRLIEVRRLLRSADAGLKPDDGLVEPGMTVTLKFHRDDSTSTFLLGAREVGHLDPTLELDVYSPTSPLGAAITGHYVGDVVAYDSPIGEQQVTIVSARPFS